MDSGRGAGSSSYFRLEFCRYFLVTSKDSMKLSRTFCFALVVMACVIVSTSGCDRRPRPYGGLPLDKEAAPIDPQSNNQ